MSRSAYGFHKAVGGIIKRRRERLAELVEREVPCFWAHKGCRHRAVGLVENWALELFPQCRTHLEQGRKLGYAVYEPEQPR